MSLRISISRPGRTTAILFLIACFMLLAIGLHNQSTQRASALSGADFNPGRIIDDAVFYNAESMSSSQIQSFLNSKVPLCDTQGTGPSGYGNTRAEYAASKGWHGPPYTCLRDYKQNTPQMEAASGLCESLPAKSNSSSAQIIYDVAVACGINPQVLVVLLEKEQSLVTDVWPLDIQLKNATGFACPDTAPCDPNFAGFFYQVYYAARQFKVYKANPNSYNYRAGRTNTIYWHPDLSRCGSSQVYIENQATAALYIYTPYRPNGAALNNLRGTGDSCSSYGNRNFWRLFSDWFGSTFGITEEENGIYRLWNKNSNTHFMTADIDEARRYLAAGWHYDRVVSYSSPTGKSVYRLYNKTTNSHFFTTSSNEVTNYTKAGWINDGVVFKAPATGKAVYRLFNKNTGGHIYTPSLLEVQNYSLAGWHFDGLGYYSNQSNDNSAVYRLYNKSTRSHILISNQAELGAYTAAGWINDGIAFYSEASGISVYRLFNSSTRSHFFTTSSTEVANYTKAGWINDGVVFYGSINISISRVYDQSTSTHKLTKSSSVIAQQNIVNDGMIIKGLREGGVPVYELFNKSTGSYLYTSSSNELNSYISAGWTNNGSIFNAPQSGNPVYRMYSSNTQKHLITSSLTEVNNYTAAGWTSDGVVFYSNI